MSRVTRVLATRRGVLGVVMLGCWMVLGSLLFFMIRELEIKAERAFIDMIFMSHWITLKPRM